MPDTIEQIMKEKVQKLEKALRAREERIMALETENAMLYLRLAECQGSMRSCRNEATHLKRLYENDENYIHNTKNSVKSLSNTIKDLKKELKDLRNDATKLPGMIMCDFDMTRNKAIKQLEFFSSSQSSDIRVLQGQLLEKEQLLDEALHRAASEKSRRRTLHNTIIEIRGNIRVHCRIRPLIGRLDSAEDEFQLGKKGTPSEQVVHCFDEETVEVIPSKPVGGRIEKKMFEYERVYGPNDNQANIFKDVGPLLTSLLDGYNVCIMAYGQTGSGKTHTMLGSHQFDVDVDPDHPIHDEGIIPRAIRELFRLMNERESRTESFTVEVSLAEIYVNEVRDLLAARMGQTEKMRQDIVTNAEGSIELPSLCTQVVTGISEVMDLVFWGMTHRHEDSTKVHAHSSRSHLIVQVNIYTTTNQSPPLKTQRSVDESGYTASPPGTPRGTRKNPSQLRSPSPSLHNRRRSKHISKSDLVNRSPAAPRSRSPSPPGSGSSSASTGTTVKTKLQLVDLAGSECVGMSGVTGQGLRETSHINKSLSALADVLGALSEHRSHIPYRNTKLTHILQDTIGGDAKLMVMLCVSPAQRYITESLQCLGFGTRARQVARGEAKKRKPMVWQQGQVSIDLSQVNNALRGSSGSLSPRTMIPQRKRLQSIKNADSFNHF